MLFALNGAYRAIPPTSKPFRVGRTSVLVYSDRKPVHGLERQKSWTSPLHKQRADPFVFSSNDSNSARLLACTAHGSGDWLNALPSTSLGLHQTDDQLRIASSVRLGAPYLRNMSVPFVALWRRGMAAMRSAAQEAQADIYTCLLYTSPSPRDLSTSRMPSSA